MEITEGTKLLDHLHFGDHYVEFRGCSTCEKREKEKAVEEEKVYTESEHEASIDEATQDAYQKGYDAGYDEGWDDGVYYGECDREHAD